MRQLILLTLTAAMLAGCVAVPVAEPAGVYVAPAPIVVRPYFFYGYHGHGGGHRRGHRWR